MTRLLGMLLFLILIAPCARSQKKLTSGIYRGLGVLYLNVKNDSIAGYYESERGRGQFSTLLYFRGKINKKGSESRIQTFYPGDKDSIPGKFRITSDTTFRIDLKEHPPGNLFGLEGDKDDFELENKMNWIRIGYAKKDKCPIYTLKSDGTYQRAIALSKGDFVGIVKKDSDMCQVKIYRKDKWRIYWLSRMDIYLL